MIREWERLSQLASTLRAIYDPLAGGMMTRTPRPTIEALLAVLPELAPHARRSHTPSRAGKAGLPEQFDRRTTAVAE